MAISQQSKVFHPASQPASHVRMEQTATPWVRIVRGGRKRAGGKLEEFTRKRGSGTGNRVCVMERRRVGWEMWGRGAGGAASRSASRHHPTPGHNASLLRTRVLTSRWLMDENSWPTRRDVSTHTYTLSQQLPMLRTPAGVSPWKDPTHKPKWLCVYEGSGRLRR